MTVKIVDTLSVIDRTEAQALAMGVNDAFAEANRFAGEAMAHYIEAGELLSQARSLFIGDLEYGQWRSENTTVSKGWAGKLVKVFETYGKKPPAELPFSALGELAGASPKLQKEIIEKAKDPEQKTPSVRDIKKAKKEEKAKALVGDERVAQQLAKKSAPPKEPTISMEAQAQDAINMPVHERISIWNTIEPKNRTEIDAFILFGLPAYFDGAPNIDTLIFITHAFTKKYETTEFEEACTIIKEWMK